MDETLQVFEQVAQYFGLLADPTRLRILSCLCAEERPVHEVVEKIGLTQANISRHLNILYRAGVEFVEPSDRVRAVIADFLAQLRRDHEPT